MSTGGGTVDPGKVDLCIKGEWTSQIVIDGNVYIAAGAQVNTPGPTTITGQLKINLSGGTSVHLGGPVSVGSQSIGTDPVPCE